MVPGFAKSAKLLILTAALAACGPSGTIVIVEVSGSESAVTALRLSITLNARPATQIETFAPSATELDLQLPEDSLGQLELTLDAVDCHGCTTARATATQFLVGMSRYELSMTLTVLPSPACPSGVLLSPRSLYVPVVLDRSPNTGQVYIASGADFTDPSGPLLKTEIYDPGRLSSRLSQPLLGVSANVLRLNDGRVLMAGGYDGTRDMYVGMTQLYDPMRDEISQGASLRMARSGHSTVVLGDGRVLTLGGKVDSPRRVTASAEIYDPSRDTWTLVDSMAQTRLYPSAVLLSNGKVLVSGGITEQDLYPQALELFDPAAAAGSQWTSPGNLIQGRWKHASFLLPDEKVLIVGGLVGDTQLESSEIFDPNAPGSTAMPVSPARFPFANAAFTVLKNGAVLATGGGNGRATTNTQIFSLANRRFEEGPPLFQPRAQHGAALLPDGSVLLCSGISGAIVNDATATAVLATERLYLDSCP